MADRQFFGHAPQGAAVAAGADLLWPVVRDVRLPREVVPDGILEERVARGPGRRVARGDKREMSG